MTEGKSVESIIRAKNREIRSERERIQTLEITNTIISAYLAILVERAGEVRIPKKAVSEALGSFSTSARSEGEDYIISVEKTASACEENTVVGEKNASACEENTVVGKKVASACEENTVVGEKTASAGEESE